jgi:spore maturation protein CgeB
MIETKKKIIVIGDRSIAEMPEDLNDAFKKLNYESHVYYFHYNKPLHKTAWGFINTPFSFSKKIGYFIMYLINKNINKRFTINILKNKPDIALIINGFSLSKNSLLKLKTANINLITWVVDDPSKARFSNFIETCPIFDTIFCCSKNWLNFAKLFNQNIIYLPLAVNSEKYTLKTTENDYKFDLCFIGTFIENDMSSYFRFYLINFLLNLNLKIRIAGKNVSKFFNLKNRNSIISDSEPISKVLEIYNDSKIILNPYNTYNQDVISLRVFEVASMGIFQLVPYQKELSELFEDKIVFFKNLNELKDKVYYYIENDIERLNIAKNLYTIIQEKHTYKNRAETIISYLK